MLKKKNQGVLFKVLFLFLILLFILFVLIYGNIIDYFYVGLVLISIIYFYIK